MPCVKADGVDVEIVIENIISSYCVSDVVKPSIHLSVLFTGKLLF